MNSQTNSKTLALTKGKGRPPMLLTDALAHFVLQLQADVQPVLSIEPQQLDLGQMTSGELRTGTVAISTTVLDPFMLELDEAKAQLAALGEEVGAGVKEVSKVLEGVDKHGDVFYNKSKPPVLQSPLLAASVWDGTPSPAKASPSRLRLAPSVHLPHLPCAKPQLHSLLLTLPALPRSWNQAPAPRH